MIVALIVEEMYVDSEAPSLTIQGNGGGSLHIPPQLLALSELEFKKAFLLLTYIPGYVFGCLQVFVFFSHPFYFK